MPCLKIQSLIILLLIFSLVAIVEIEVVSNPIPVTPLYGGLILPMTASNVSFLSAHIDYRVLFNSNFVNLTFTATYLFFSRYNQSLILGIPVSYYYDEKASMEVYVNNYKVNFSYIPNPWLNESEPDDILIGFGLIIFNLTLKANIPYLANLRIAETVKFRKGFYTIRYLLGTARYWNTSDLYETVSITSLNFEPSEIDPTPNRTEEIQYNEDTYFKYTWIIVGKPSAEEIIVLFDFREESRDVAPLLGILVATFVILSTISILILILKKRKRRT